MAGTSGCSRQLERLKLSETSCTMGGSNESAPASDHATSSSSYLSARSGSIMEKSGDPECSTMNLEEQIEHSKSHWSILAESGCGDEDEVAEVSNLEVFKGLQRHPIWGYFVTRFTEVLKCLPTDPLWSPSYIEFNADEITNAHGHYTGYLGVGKKFAEGGQAELYEACVTWWNTKWNKWDLKNQEDEKIGRKYVLKVFKKGTFLKHLQSQMPPGLLQVIAEERKNREYSDPWNLIPKFYSEVLYATLLQDGRFAFLMQKEHADLRNVIQNNMKLRSCEDCGPFPKGEVEYIMYDVALGMDWLHGLDIVHRDLKASNVLVRERSGSYRKWPCYIADYECSIGVIGTGFFRAPEILQACKDRDVNQRREVFSKGADVYSYGMTCYEILTGKLPFEDHPLGENSSLLIDLVINQHLRPMVPEYVEDWIHKMLNMCWQANPMARPSFKDILDLLVVNSTNAATHERIMKNHYGQNFRSWHLIEISN